MQDMTMSSFGSGLEVRDAKVQFGGFVAISGVSFVARGGQITGIVGPNGAGKSSLLNAIMGLVPLATGDVLLDGQSIAKAGAAQRSKLGLSRAFQHVELFDTLTVAENVLLGRHAYMNYGLASACLWLGYAREQERAQRRAVDEVLAFFNLERWCDRRIGSLPYGTQKIVGLARAVAANPKVLLLDEVGSGLTHEEKEHFAHYVLRLQSERSQTVVWIEHDVGMVRDLSDSVVVLDYGRKLTEGPPDVVFSRKDVREAFVGANADAI
jgi:branched-chain amino acid transport system ATP-binding protein